MYYWYHDVDVFKENTNTWLYTIIKENRNKCTQLFILQKVITIVAATGLDQDEEGLGEVMTSEGIVMGAGDDNDEQLGKGCFVWSQNSCIKIRYNCVSDKPPET